MLHGLEAILRNGAIVGYIRRAEFAHSLNKPIAYGYVERAWLERAEPPAIRVGDGDRDATQESNTGEQERGTRSEKSERGRAPREEAKLVEPVAQSEQAKLVAQSEQAKLVAQSEQAKLVEESELSKSTGRREVDVLSDEWLLAGHYTLERMGLSLPATVHLRSPFPFTAQGRLAGHSAQGAQIETVAEGD